MPEGHALHRLAHRITEVFGGQRVRSTSPQGRFDAARILDGRVLSGAEAYGKHLFVACEGRPEQVRVHLGIYGKWRFEATNDHPVSGQVRWRLQGNGTTADLRGPAACELLGPAEVEEVLDRLGPDPLRDDADPDRAWEKISRSRRSVASLLMDQSVIAGIGNIYRAELLFRHNLDPQLPGTHLDRETWTNMWDDIVPLMQHGLATGRIDTVRDEHMPEAMGRAPREDAHGGEVYVYRRSGQPCLVCGTQVATGSVESRNLFWCPRCQARG